MPLFYVWCLHSAAYELFRLLLRYTRSSEINYSEMIIYIILNTTIRIYISIDLEIILENIVVKFLFFYNIYINSKCNEERIRFTVSCVLRM